MIGRRPAAIPVILALACGTHPAAPRHGSPASPPAPCAGLTVIAPGQSVEGSTEGLTGKVTAGCGAGGLGPEASYTFALEEQARVRLVLATPGHDGVLHLHAGCDPAAPEISCNEDSGGPARSILWADLPPGAYVVHADGSGQKDQGAFTLTLDARFPGSGQPPNDACDAALELDLAAGRATLSGSTFGAQSHVDPPCSSSPGGPDVFFSLGAAEDSIVEARVVSSDFSFPVLAVAAGCEVPWEACGAGALTARIGSGDHVLVVDSLGADMLGDFRIDIRLLPLRLVEEACASATPLPHSKLVHGKTSGESLFEPGCGDGEGPEDLYRLEITQDSRVDLSLATAAHDGVLHVRTDCTDPASEKACNDDRSSVSSSGIEAVLGPGTYFVIVDGHGPGDQGGYVLEAKVSPVEPD